MLMRSRRIQWNGCRVHDAASGLWSGSSITGEPRRADAGQTDCYSHWSVQAESIMSVIKRSDNGKSAEAYDIDELKNNWNHWVRTGEILFTPGNGRW